MVSGTTAAAVPIDEPTKKRVSGMIATSRMMKGVERTAFTMPPSDAVEGRVAAARRRWSVRCSNMPSGTPISAPSRPAMPTITQGFADSELTNRSSIADEMIEHGQLLDNDAGLRTQLHGFRHSSPARRGQHRQRTEGLALDLVDLAMQDVEVQAEAADHVRQQRLVDAGAGEGEAEQVVAAVPARAAPAHRARTRASTPSRQFLRHDLLDQAARDFVPRLA